ncbi:DMT family transporter [Undibacterium arcticum]
MFIGILCALGAGLLWGLVFIAPLLLGDYPGLVLSFARYIAFGLIALVPALFDWRRIVALRRADWIAALKLALVGNLLYYAALATGIQLADAPLPTMLIGTLPVVISVCANLLPGHPSETVAWRSLALPLLIIAAGLMLVNGSELAHMKQMPHLPHGSGAGRTPADYALGCAITLGAVAAWTWYPIMNGRHLKAHPNLASSTWATAQGPATLPLALLGFAGYGLFSHVSGGAYAFPLGPRPQLFIGIMLVIGLLASWLGTLLWNQASQRLPTSLAGQLIVFETLAALLYAFILRGSMPPPQVLTGVLLLCLGVLLGVHVFQRTRLRAASAA